MAALDPAFVDRLRKGDSEAEKDFVTHFSKVIREALRFRIRSSQLIEDILQETFVRVLNFVRSDRSIDHPERLGAFAHAVSINVMLELLRASTRHPPLPENSNEYADAKMLADGAVANRERKEIVAQVLSQLTPKDRDILRSLYLEEISKDEVCRHFDVDREYLRVLVHRAKLRFREVYERQGLPPL